MWESAKDVINGWSGAMPFVSMTIGLVLQQQKNSQSKRLVNNQHMAAQRCYKYTVFYRV
jgi:hypothetical protein